MRSVTYSKLIIWPTDQNVFTILAFFRFLVSDAVNADNITFIRESRNVIETQIYSRVSKQMEVFADTYTILVAGSRDEGKYLIFSKQHIQLYRQIQVAYPKTRP